MAGTAGTAIVNSIRDTVPGKEPYAVKHRQLIAHSALARFQPGATFSVRVDASDPTELVIG
jgi:hypothetical protein